MMRKSVVLNAVQVSCLSSAVRSEILEVLATQGEQCIAEVAAAIDRPAVSLYYHFEKLLEAKLLVASGDRDAHTQTETLYQAVSHRFRFNKQDRSIAYRAALRKMVKNALTQAQKRFDHAQESTATDQTQLLQVSARLNPAAADEFRRRMAELGEWLRRQDSVEGERYAITAIFAPVPRRERSLDAE